MDFIDDRSGKAAAKGRQDAVAKAREAREARRLAQEQRGTVEQAAAREKAVLKLQPTLRRHLTFLNSRTLQRNEWDAALAAASPSPPAGQQLALCGWLLRFFQPTKDDERLRAFCGVLVACMEQDQHPLMFVSLALNRHLALWWSNTTRRLLLTLCQLLSPGAAVLSDLLKADPSLTASANAAAAKKRLNSHFGPLLRVLLLLCEPDKWKLGAQLNAAGGAGEQAARALGLMGQSVVLAAAESLASAAGTLALGVHAVADASLLGAAVAVASFPLQSASSAPTPEALKALLLGGLLRVPALTTRVGTAAARLGKGSLIFSRLTELGPSLAADVAASAEVLGADGALCVAGNLLSLLPAQPPPSAAQVLGMARLVGALLALQPQAGSATPRASSSSSGVSGGGNSYFHPLRGWTSKVAGAAISEHLDAVAAQLSALWSAKMLPLLYTDALAVPLGTRPVDGALRALNADQLQSLAARACAGAQLHAAALKALPPRRAPGLARLAYSTHLVPALWALLRLLDERKAVPFSRLIDDLIHDPTQSPHAPLLALLLEAGTPLLTVIDDKEVHEDRAPFAPDELCELVRLLNRLAFRLHWELADDASPLVASTSGVAAHSIGASAMRRTLRELATQMLSLLAERDARRPFCPPEMWLVPELRYSELHRELNEGKPRAKRLLGNVPWVVPFERRVNIFRELVAKEKETLPNEQLQEHLKGYRIKIRREHLLEDGYVQMGGLGPEQLKGTIRVEFVNSLGLSEAGIDRTGVFKEFMEDTAATAFDPNRGLFRLTKANLLYPSPSSAQADPYHLRYFEFVGRMLGKAIYEGIVLDVPLADFFVLKLLHKSATLDELPSLDGELASSLDFLKRYERAHAMHVALPSE